MKMIKHLQINNYKSINQVNLNCSRINVLIGEPNVGKSNILEALDLSYLSWIMARNNGYDKEVPEKINIKEYFRVNKVSDLFHLGDLSKQISIIHPGFSYDTTLQFSSKKDKNIFELKTSNNSLTAFDNDFIPVEGVQYFSSPIHPYRYKENIQFHDFGNYLNMLMPPYGNNLLEVIQYNIPLKDLIQNLTQEYGFEFNIDISSHKLYIQLRINKGLVYSIPWKGLADTFKRLLFYVAAISCNNAHVVTLEEPDAHSFPKYVSFLGDEIIQTSNRQFFIATHNPYLLNNLIENTPEGELAVFVCGYNKNKYETIVKKLSNEDLSELLDYGIDIFFNINRYLNDHIAPQDSSRM